MNVYNTHFANIDFFEEKSLMVHTWRSSSSFLNEDYYKEELTNLYNEFIKYRPSKMLYDDRTLIYRISPDLQHWTNENVTAKMVAQGFEKIAVVMSPDIFALVAVESMVEEEHKLATATRFFSDMQEAKTWLGVS
ncbi:MAG: hypothetical protein EAZ95_12760 [Bacteroidetes bacterium]|nr:MAG: hypothetical protein EAZ95_12760 [Bacteroidota bacterium]